MKNRLRSVSSGGFAIALSLILVMACSEKTLTTAPIRPAPVSPRFAPSGSFYQGSDGYYFWDGRPPSGDLDPADIISAEAGGSAPIPHRTGGWISGKMTFVGHQSKLDLVYSVDSLGHSFYSNAQASSGWRYALAYPSNQQQEHYFDQSLYLLPNCDYALQVGGTAYARKAVPFGIDISLIKFSVSATLGSFTWGETSRPLQAFSDPGYLCDYPPVHCETYCPVDGDPANSPYGGQGGGGNGQPTDERGDYGGYSSPGGFVGGASYCVDWIDWWVSFDGGTTWQYDYRQCTRYEQM